MPRKLKRYMVGFDQDRQTVYGRDEKRTSDSDTGVRYADAMTLLQAQRKLRQLQGKPAKTIYKLVPIRAPKPKPQRRAG
jgi:hypothetical protein